VCVCVRVDGWFWFVCRGDDQLDPDTLRVIRTGSLKDLPLPGTVANIAVGDRLVAINKHSLAFKPYSAVRRLLQTLGT